MSVAGSNVTSRSLSAASMFVSPHAAASVGTGTRFHCLTPGRRRRLHGHGGDQRHVEAADGLGEHVLAVLVDDEDVGVLLRLVDHVAGRAVPPATGSWTMIASVRTLMPQSAQRGRHVVRLRRDQHQRRPAGLEVLGDLAARSTAAGPSGRRLRREPSTTQIASLISSSLGSGGGGHAAAASAAASPTCRTGPSRRRRSCTPAAARRPATAARRGPNRPPACASGGPPARTNATFGFFSCVSARIADVICCSPANCGLISSPSAVCSSIRRTFGSFCQTCSNDSTACPSGP